MSPIPFRMILPTRLAVPPMTLGRGSIAGGGGPKAPSSPPPPPPPPPPPGPTYSELVLADSPIAYWRLGEVAGPVAVDETGNGHDATNNDINVVFGVPGLIVGSPDTCIRVPDDLYGQFGVPYGPDFYFGDFSVEIWFRLLVTSDTIADATVLQYSKSVGPNYSAWALAFTQAGMTPPEMTVMASCWTPSGGAKQLFGTADVNDGAPHHAVFTRKLSTGALELWIDGVLADSDTHPDTTHLFDLGDDTPIVFAGPSGGGTEDPEYDEFALYRSVLSGPQILAHYNSGIGA